MQELNEVKLDWMLNEIEDDGFSTTEDEVVQILKGENLEDIDAALVDYVQALEKEWQAEGTL